MSGVQKLVTGVPVDRILYHLASFTTQISRITS